MELGSHWPEKTLQKSVKNHDPSEYKEPPAKKVKYENFDDIEEDLDDLDYDDILREVDSRFLGIFNN